MLEMIHPLVLIKVLDSPLGVGPACVPWQAGVSRTLLFNIKEYICVTV